MPTAPVHHSSVSSLCLRLKCVEDCSASQDPWHLQAAHVHRFLDHSQGHKPRRRNEAEAAFPSSFLLSVFFPLFWSQSETVILAAFSISMNWSKPRFHFVPWMAFLQSTTSVSSLFAFTPERIWVTDESMVIEYSFLSLSKASSRFTRSEFWMILPKELQFKGSLRCLRWNEYQLKALSPLKLHVFLL